MSNTPRTDAMLTLLGLLGAVGSTSRFAEHARNLERELNEVEQQCDELATALKMAMNIMVTEIDESEFPRSFETIRAALAPRYSA